MRRRLALFLVVSLAAACSSQQVRDQGAGQTTGSAAPVATGGTGSTGSAPSAPSSIVDGTDTSAPAAAGILTVPAGAPCAMHPPAPGGETTFVQNGRLWAADADNVVTCLADLGGRDPSWVSWSPDGDEVLIGPDTVLRADGTFAASGYFADNTNVRWSAPTGKALIAPKASTGELIWRNAHDDSDRIDVTFTDATTSAAYHPAGKHIAAAGVGRDGSGPGVFIASNRGANAQRIGVLEAGTEASEVDFEMNGDSIVFVHHHADGSAHVHRYGLTSGQLDIVADLDITPTDLTASPVDQGDLAWTESRSTVNSVAYVLVAGATTPVVARDPAGDHLSRPLGWLPAHRLLFSSTLAGPAAGTFDLWQWSPTGQTELIANVHAAAPRTVHGAYDALPLQLGSGFG